MNRLLAALRSVGILIAIWAMLALVGLGFGVVPNVPGLFGPSDERAPAGREPGVATEAAPDAGAQSGRRARGDASVEAADAGTPDERVTMVVAPFLACDGSVTEPSLAAIDVIGDARPELAIACGASTTLVSIVAREGAIVPLRVAVFDAAGVDGANADGLEASTPRASDVDGDSLPDLVLPFHRVGPDGGVAGGGLFLVRRASSGAFEAPVSLAPIACPEVALAELDGRPGAEIVAVNRGNVLSRRASSVWVFSGGASLARVATLIMGVGGSSVALADLDRDGEKDLVAVSTEETDAAIFFGDGTGGFPRRARLAVASAAEVVTGDLNGDGADDALLRGIGLHLVLAGPAESLAPTPVEAPSGIREIALFDVNEDRKRDVVGLADGRLVSLERGDELAFEERTLFSVTGAHVAGFALADFDADSKLDAVLIGRRPEAGAPWEIYVVGGLSAVSEVTRREGDASAIGDAPLSLSIALR